MAESIYCACGHFRRPGGRYCKVCHAAKEREARNERQREARGESRELRADNQGLFGRLVREAKREILCDALITAGGNVTAAAIYLGIHRNTIQRAMREVGLTAKDARAQIMRKTAQPERMAS